MLSPIVVGKASTTVIPPQTNFSQTATATTSIHIHKFLSKNVAKYPILQDYLHADLKFIGGKQKQLISHGIATMQVSPTSFSFLERTGDNSLKRHCSFLESPLARNFFPRNPNMGAANYILYHSKIQKAIYCIYYLNYLLYLSMLSACYIFVCIFMSICPPNIRIGTLRHLKFCMKEQVTCSNCYSLVMHLPSLMTVKTLPHVREHRTITLDGHAKH